ncbi:PREDICTED: butyrophilin subfamily 3 member A2-like, partial [Leptosomus discolor]|uniref:butyrophilin subfamily 3 member A2-like n=1 Tax=Leptosomus discolor TaxID=188344 RepID=UPI000522E15B
MVPSAMSEERGACVFRANLHVKQTFSSDCERRWSLSYDLSHDMVCRPIKPLDISQYRLLASAGVGCNIAPKGKNWLVVKVQFSVLVSFSEEINEIYSLDRYGKGKYVGSGRMSHRFLTSTIHAELKMDTLDLAIQIIHIKDTDSFIQKSWLLPPINNDHSSFDQASMSQYKIIPPDKPVVGIIGKGVILPCQLRVKIIPEMLSVQWIFTGNSKKIDVTTYNGKNAHNPVQEDKTYQGRTTFFQSEFNNGNISLHLKNVMPSDKGKYTCSVFFKNWYDEVVVDLDVAAKGDESSVSLDGHVGQGICLTCKSQGWFPEPKVVWLNSKGQTRKEEVTTQTTKTSSGVFDVVSSMNLKPGSDREVSCRVVNNLLNTFCESRVLISGSFKQSRKADFWEARSHA